MGILDALKDFWDSGPFSSGGTRYEGGGTYSEETARVAQERGVSYDEAHRAREDAAKEMSKVVSGPPGKA